MGVMRVAFQGERGALGEVAIEQFWCNRGPVRAVGLFAFRSVASAVARGAVDAGVLPVANTIVGEITSSLTALAAFPENEIIGETVVAVDLALMAVRGVQLSDIRFVSSHPLALAQCGRWLAMHPRIAFVPVYDSAGAAAILAEHRNRHSGVIAEARVADLYKFCVLESAVADRADSETRFVVIRRRRRSRDRGAR